MSKANKVGLVKRPHIIVSNIVECVEKGRYCHGKFIPTRIGQTNTCLKCMQMLEGELPERFEIKGKNLVI